jgi:uncharacterized membrane protein YfcA
VKTSALWYLVAGAAAGLLAGFSGIGGGLILVPLMTGVLHLSQHKAHGTSLAAIVPIAIVAAAVYALRGDVNWVLVATIGSGSVIGVVAGAKLMMRVSGRRLRQLFGVYAIAVAALMLVRSLGFV